MDRAVTPSRSLSEFEGTFRTFLDELFEVDPVFATGTGEHSHDGAWPDLSDVGRTSRLAFVARWLETFEGQADLSAGDAIDRDLVMGELEAMRFADQTLREAAWDPMTWVYLLGDGLFGLLAREFAPLGVRLASVAARLETMPAVLASARSVIVGVDGRPVGRLQTETAIAQLPGIEELMADALGQAAAAADDPAVLAVTPRLTAAAASAREALAAFEVHLRDVVLPASEGDGRLGPDLFAEKMRHAMRSDELTPARILAEAEATFAAVRAEMVRLARDLWPAWRPGETLPTEDEAIVRGVLDAIAREHPRAEDKLDYCRAETARIETFCRERDLIGLGDEPLTIQWTPVFLRPFANAMLIAPGALEQGLETFFAITPLPDDWSEEQRESALREDNDRLLRLITIHEAVPGHYLQGAYANRCPSLPRAVFASSVFAEGWAVYVTQVMMDVGYGADDPALLLSHWKYFLRAAINAILDARIHCDAMTQDEAMELMVAGGFQELSEATAKFDRARLSSTQLSTYFAGSMELWAIELDARRRAAGDATLRARDLPGGFGDTAGFSYREHLERVLDHGCPPTALLKRMLVSSGG